MPPALRPEHVTARPLAELAALLGLKSAHQAGPDAHSAPAGLTGVSGLTHDSRRVRPGDLYAALPGSRVHGARFCADAAAAGAVAVLTDQAGRAAALASGLPVFVVAGPRARLG